jgi:hypothetical protein
MGVLDELGDGSTLVFLSDQAEDRLACVEAVEPWVGFSDSLGELRRRFADSRQAIGAIEGDRRASSTDPPPRKPPATHRPSRHAGILARPGHRQHRVVTSRRRLGMAREAFAPCVRRRRFPEEDVTWAGTQHG